MNNKFIFHSSYYRMCLNNVNAINITTVHLIFTYEKFGSGLKKYSYLAKI